MPRMRIHLSLLMAALLLVVGCSSDSEAEKKKNSANHIYYSPNAEPLNGGILGHPTCDEAIGGWFDRVDTNHDGFIDASEFIADAKAQFARMDIDHNGYLVSEELDRYRAPYRTDIKTDSDLQKKTKKHGSKSDNDPLTLIDPVMSADTNLDFKVTPEEFGAQSHKNFNELDSEHTGRISKAQVMHLCDRSNKN